MLFIAIILLIIGAVALVVYYAAAPEPLLRAIGLIGLGLGLVLLLIALLLDGSDEHLNSVVTLLSIR